MDKDTLAEIGALWRKISEVEGKLSGFTDMRHGESVDRIDSLESTSEEALCDVDEAYDQRVADVEEALCELTEMLNL